MSSTPPPPVKTALGHEELRQRTRTFSQRHRTVLLLVDGKRLQDEVLALALKAGVASNFFDELVAAGLVDLQEPVAEIEVAVASVSEPDVAAGVASGGAEVAAAAEPPAVDRTDLDEAVFHDVVLGVEVPERPETLEPAPLTDPQGGRAEARSEPSFEDSVPVPLVLPAGSAEALPVRPARVKFAAPLYQPPPPRPAGTERRSAVPRLTPAPSLLARRAGEGGVLRDEPKSASVDEEPMLAEVRSLLIGTLLVDGPVSSSLTVLRVGRARDRYELIGLVWQIERALVTARRPVEAMSRLRRARELLGLGNTVVDEDTKPGSSTH